MVCQSTVHSSCSGRETRPSEKRANGVEGLVDDAPRHGQLYDLGVCGVGRVAGPAADLGGDGRELGAVAGEADDES
jgi:hypothetical protein